MADNISHRESNFLGFINNIYRKDKSGKLLIVALIMIAFIIFMPCLFNGFVYWDDPEYIFQNPNLLQFGKDWNWHIVKHIFTSEVGANYNPLPIFSYVLERYFFAQDTVASPFIYHFDNLLLHIACTIAVFVLFLKMGLNKEASFLGALLFAIHPMRVESVAWLTERKDVLYGFFYIVALITYVNYIQTTEAAKWYTYTLLLSLLAYFSKIQTVSLPLSMIAFDVYFKRKWHEPKILLLEKLPWWILSLLFGLINIYYLRSKNVINVEVALKSYGFFQKLAIGANAYVTYIVKFIYPYKLTAYYAFPIHVPYYYYVALVILGGIFIAVWKYRRNTIFLFGFLFFTGNIMFLLQIVSAGRAYMADRFTYIAYIGLFFIVAKLFSYTFSHYRFTRKILIAVFITYISILSVITFKQCKVWQNTLTLWENYIDLNKDDYFGYNQIGSHYVDMASETNPILNMGIGTRENVQLAVKYLNIAIAKDSINGRSVKEVTADLYETLGAAYLLVNDARDAELQFSEAIRFSPNVLTYSKRVLLYYQEKKYDLAIKDFDSIIKIAPFDFISYYRRALSKGFLGRYGEALPDIDSAIKLRDDEPKYYIVRAQINQKLNNLEESKKDAIKAKQMGAAVPAELLK